MSVKIREHSQEPRKAPKLTPSIRRLIAIESRRQPRVPRDALAADLVKRIAAMDVGKPPTEDTLKRLISSFRAREDTKTPMWNIGQAADYGISPGSFARIFEIQRAASEWAATTVRIPMHNARWIGLLSPMIPKERDLYNTAWAYWLFELIETAARPDDAPEEPVDTTELDDLLAEKNFAAIRDRAIEMHGVIFPDDDVTASVLKSRAQRYREKQNGGAK